MVPGNAGWASQWGHCNWGHKGWVTLGLDCFSNKVVNLGSSQKKRMDYIPVLAPMSWGLQLLARLECAFFNQNRTVTINRTWLTFLIIIANPHSSIAALYRITALLPVAAATVYISISSAQFPHILILTNTDYFVVFWH